MALGGRLSLAAIGCGSAMGMVWGLRFEVHVCSVEPPSAGDVLAMGLASPE